MRREGVLCSFGLIRTLVEASSCSMAWSFDLYVALLSVMTPVLGAGWARRRPSCIPVS